jgi:hypothetical protein
VAGRAAAPGRRRNVTILAPDTGRAREFYEAVLPSHGAEPEVQLSYRVDNQGATFHLWQPVD